MFRPERGGLPNPSPALVALPKCLLFGFVTKPYNFIGFGDIYGPKPYEFIGFGDIYGPKPYEFIGFGDTVAVLYRF